MDMGIFADLWEQWEYDNRDLGPYTNNQETRRIKMAKKKARKATKRGSARAARGPKLSEFILEQREKDGYNPDPEASDAYGRLGGQPCTDGVKAFEFLESLEKKGWSVAKICEFAREKNPGWYETHIVEAYGLDTNYSQDIIEYLREAADALESGYDKSQDYADTAGETASVKVGTVITNEIKRLRDKASELENEPDFPLVRLVSKKGNLQLEVVDE